MLSGEFEAVAVDFIWWDRASRTRKEITEESIQEKVDSISRRGLIHPLVIRRDGQGVSGETRWNAVRRLGWTSIPIQWADTLDERELLAIELEENIKRTDLAWQDQCEAMSRYHALHLELDPTWTQEKTATELSVSRSKVIQQLGVAQALRDGNSRVVAAKDFSVARGIVVRERDRKAADILSNIGNEDLPVPLRLETPIVCADFSEWVKTYQGGPFNLINCDFPYGINADKFQQGAAEAFGGYEDSPEVYWKLVKTLCDNKEKLLGTSGHILFWFSMRWYTETLAALREHFFVDEYPLIWHKSDNRGTLPDPQRRPRRVYEVAFLCSFGDRKIIQAVSNTFSTPTVRLGEHMSEKPQDMLEHFFRMFVDGNTRLLDPTCGSGSALRAADKLNAASVLGLELNPEFAEAASRAWLSRNNSHE